MRQKNTSKRRYLAAVLCMGIAVAVHAPGAWAQGDAEVAAIFDRLDSDHDGRVTHTEFAVNKIMVMAARDRNRDGNLSRDEVLISDEAFAAVDTNNDGVVSGYEFVTGGLGRYENLDRNVDGVIVIDELKAWINGTK